MTTTVRDDRRAFDRLYKDLRKMGGMAVTVGVHDDAGQHDGSDVTVAEVSATHEFGSGRIPERSFLRSTFDRKEPQIRDAMYDAVNEVAQDRLDPQQAMDRVGMVARSMVQDTMRAGINPPLAPSTLAAREAKAAHGGGLQSMQGKHTPLIDSGQLLASITHKVEAAHG